MHMLVANAIVFSVFKNFFCLYLLKAWFVGQMVEIDESLVKMGLNSGK